MENQPTFSRRVVVKSSILGLLTLPIQNVLYAKNIIAIKNVGNPAITEPKRYPAIVEEIVAEVVGASHFNEKGVFRTFGV